MPADTNTNNYYGGNDLGPATVLPPFVYNETPYPWDISTIPGTWGWNGINPIDPWDTGGGGATGGASGSMFAPPIQRYEPLPDDGSDYNRIFNELLQAENARRAIAGQSPLRPYEADTIAKLADEAQRKVVLLNSGSPTDPNHGVIDPTQSSGGQAGGLGNIAIGIPGVVGLGLGGLVYGGLLNGGGGGGGGTVGTGQSGGGIVYPGPYPAGVTDTADSGNPVVYPAPVPIDPSRPAGPYPAGVNDTSAGNPTIYPAPPMPNTPTAPTEAGGNPTIVPPVTPPITPTPTEAGGGGGTILPVPVTPGVVGGGGGGGGGTTPTTTTPTSTISNPLDRNFYREGSQTIADLNRLGAGLYGNYAQFAPQYTQADLANYESTLGTLGRTNNQLTQIASDQTRTANTALRQGNLSDAQQFGPQADALRRAVNPELYSNLSALDAAAQRGIQPSEYEQGLGDTFKRGFSELGNALNQDAQYRLSLGSSLTPEEQAAASQAAREGWSARGLVNSNGAVAEEVLNRYQLGNQRLKERQGFAQSAYGQQQSAQGQLNSLGLNLAGLDQTRQGQNVSNLATAANLRNVTAFDPFNMASTQNVGSNASLFGQGSGFSSGAQSNQNTLKQFDPFAAYPADVYGSNYNAANARSIAAGNNAAALAGAKDTANGALVQNFLSLLGNLYGRT